ncbi:MAG: hypothetical protein WCL21_11610 [Mariniphaga sp.]
MKTLKQYHLTIASRFALLMMSGMLFLSFQSHAQSENKNTLLQMITDDRTTMDAIAGYNKEIQSHVLIVAQTPELLTKMEELQKRSQEQFKIIIENHDRDTQTAFYEMARYPNLISELVGKGKPSPSEVAQIVSNYPLDIHETAKNYARSYYGELLRIDRLNSEIDRAFKVALEPYKMQTRESVNVLLGYPEIVSVLVDDKTFTRLLGEVYHEDPNWLRRRLEITSVELAANQKEDLESYKNQIQNDPQAYKEMLKASEKFAKEKNEVRYLENSSDPVVEVRVINSYPFWFGYPYWYSDPYWRPRPLYYHTGFYRNHFGNIIFVGLPSFQFMNWHYNYHPTLFPHLSYNYYNFYDNHYMKRYRESPMAFPHNGFYRSIESHVINNPKVNNSALQRIDRQRGTNIVRQPDFRESNSVRRSSDVINRPSGTSGARQGETRGATINSRSLARPNTETPGTAADRRQYNTGSPKRSEGSVNRQGTETRRESIRKEAAPSLINQGSTPARREAAPASRSSVTERRAAPAAKTQSSGRSERREARVANTESRRSAVNEKKSSRSVSSEERKNNRER